MGKANSQKFIARNRAPRVQIEYDLELYGAEKKVNLPFVMGVMADLSGKPADPLAPVSDRKFLEIDVDNFDERLKSMKKRQAKAAAATAAGGAGTASYADGGAGAGAGASAGAGAGAGAFASAGAGNGDSADDADGVFLGAAHG